MPKGICLNTGRTHFKPGHNMNKGSKNPRWKGGKFKNKEGYVLIRKPKHHLANKSGYIKEHRYVYFKETGINLRENEVIHHINGIKDDNRIENLKVMDRGDHAILHCSKKIKYICLICKKIIFDKPSDRRKYCSRKCFHRRGEA